MSMALVVPKVWAQHAASHQTSRPLGTAPRVIAIVKKVSFAPMGIQALGVLGRLYVINCIYDFDFKLNPILIVH